MNKPFTFSERLQTLIDKKGISKSDLARVCGIDRSNITRYLKGTYEAKQDVLYRIAQAYNVNEAWLLGYDIEMDKYDPDEIKRQHDEINEIFDQMSPELRSHALALLRGLVPQAQNTDSRGESD